MMKRCGLILVAITALCALGMPTTILPRTALAGAAETGGPKALLLDGPGPWDDQTWVAAAREFRSMLQAAGYEVRTVAPAQLAAETATPQPALIAAPSLERLPLSAFKAIAACAQHGGSLLASGGEPFREPLYESAPGAWVSRQDLLARAPRRTILEPATTGWKRATPAPEAAAAGTPVAGPGGRQDSLLVRMGNDSSVWVGNNMAGLDRREAPPFTESPFHGGETLTVVTVRGTPETSLAIEWRCADGTRFSARVPLTREWRTHVLRPGDFSSGWGGASRSGGPARKFDPQQARGFAFYYAPVARTQEMGAVEYALGPVAVAAAPAGVEDFEPPTIETFAPWYQQYDAVGASGTVRYPNARPRGLTTAAEPEGRYLAIGPLLHPAASRYVTKTGAAYFWVPQAGLAPADREELVQMLRGVGTGLALLNGGPKEFTVFPGEAVGLGARVLNASSGAANVAVTWSVRRGRNAPLVREASVSIPAGQTQEVAGADLAPLPPGEYEMETVLRQGNTVCDRIHGSLRVFDPTAPKTQPRLRIENGHFVAGGQRVFLNGVNYWPRVVAGLEINRYWDHWLTPRNYDPQAVEADLALLETLGFNLVSVQYNKTEQARPLVDFLERCRQHHMWVHLSVGGASGLRADAERVLPLIAAAQLAGNPTIFAYELAWEPKLGNHNARSPFDPAWRRWIADQYGSVAEAQAAWGAAAPRNGKGEVSSPRDEQISTDGPHRVMVAAYRRFADDAISRVYGRVVRQIRSVDPHALFAIRSGYGGTGQAGNNAIMGYDLAAGAAHLDVISPEGYGLPIAYAQGRKTGFVTAYARLAGNGKPVFWAEFGASVGLRHGTSRTQQAQARLCDTLMRVVADSGADATAVWWFPGGWRLNELSDFGIINPDGSPRESARVIAAWGRKLNGSTQPAAGAPVVLEADRDADARGLYGLWQRLGDQYVKAREAGRPVQLVTPGTGTDTATMPLVQIGNVPYQGKGPLKYANAEIGTIQVSWPGGEKTVENGSEVEVPAGTTYRIQVQMINTGEAAWVPVHGSAQTGDCLLRTNAGEAMVRDRVSRFGSAALGPLQGELHDQPVEVTGRLWISGRGPFGEKLSLRLRPRGR